MINAAPPQAARPTEANSTHEIFRGKAVQIPSELPYPDVSCQETAISRSPPCPLPVYVPIIPFRNFYVGKCLHSQLIVNDL